VNGNGRIDPQERLSDRLVIDEATSKKSVPKDDTLVVFDLGDVYWLSVAR